MGLISGFETIQVLRWNRLWFLRMKRLAPVTPAIFQDAYINLMIAEFMWHA